MGRLSVESTDWEKDTMLPSLSSTWKCACGLCNNAITNQTAWFFYYRRVINASNEKHQKFSVMQYDADQTDDPQLRQLILWRMGDPRIIAANRDE